MTTRIAWPAIALASVGLAGCSGEQTLSVDSSSPAAVAPASPEAAPPDAGDSAPPTSPATDVPAPEAEPEVLTSRTIAIGASLERRPIELTILGEDTAPAVLFIATIHGDEYAGTPLLEELEFYLEANPTELKGYRALLIKDANPDGHAANRRRNARGVDLNRNFPSASFRARPEHGPAALSEPESRAIDAVLSRFAPIRIISLHQPFGLIDFDGPAEDLAYAMSTVCDLPVKRIGARAGSLGSYAGNTLDLPIVTVELQRTDHRLSGPELWRRYGAMLLAAVRPIP